MNEINEQVQAEEGSSQGTQLAEQENQVKQLKEGVSESSKLADLQGVTFEGSTVTKEGGELMKRFNISFKNNALYVNGKSIIPYNQATSKVEVSVGKNNTLSIKSTDKPKDGKPGLVETYLANQFDSGLNLYQKEDPSSQLSFPKGDSGATKDFNKIDLGLKLDSVSDDFMLKNNPRSKKYVSGKEAQRKVLQSKLSNVKQALSEYFNDDSKVSVKLDDSNGLSYLVGTIHAKSSMGGYVGLRSSERRNKMKVNYNGEEKNIQFSKTNSVEDVKKWLTENFPKTEK